MLSGAPAGTGVITLLTGIHGVLITGTTIMDIITTGTLIITAITTTGSTTAIPDIMTFITVAYGHTLRW